MPLLAPLALVVFAVEVAVKLGGPVTDTVVVTGLINLVIVIGLYVFVGNSGVVSFGHIAFVAVGAYTAGLLVIPVETKAVLQPDLPALLADSSAGALPATILGGLVAAAFATVLAIPLMRLNGLAAGLATFGVLVVVHVVANSWYQVTNGAAGISGVPIGVTARQAMAWGTVAIVAAFLFQRTGIGLRLRASREDEIAAQALGVRVRRERGIAWVLSAFLCGTGGALYGQYLGSFNADAFYLSMTFLTLAMLVIGGMTSLLGSVVGVVVVTAAAEALRRLEQGTELGPLSIAPRPGLREVGLAFIMLLILLLRPNGLTGGREFSAFPDWLRQLFGARTDAEDRVHDNV
jgi:branched-chain amino acid transport system permease protein